MLTAIGHDLRTPITRLKLRAEFIDDEELRTKILGDLDELETMVSATLAFGRDSRVNEPVSSVDLVELLRTILDETSDANPEAGRSADLSRAAASDRARASGGVEARAGQPGVERGELWRVGAGDHGAADGRHGHGNDRRRRARHSAGGNRPGVRAVSPPEQSRNRETGGVGLGLPIARNMLRAHGGDVVLSNRPRGGLKVQVTLPV